jgi:hypothetical protein
MDRRAVFVITFLTVVMSGLLRPAAAQDATPNPADEHIDLAAMALTSDDMPDGFELEGEKYFAGQAVAENFSNDPDEIAEVMDTGLIVAYASEYNNAAGDVVIRSFIEQFDSEDGARAGFDILEDDSRTASSGVNYSDEPLEGIGEPPGEITTYSRESSATAPSLDRIDVTFRLGNFLAGVTVEGTGGAAPAQSDAISMARALEQRMRMALDGEELAGIDPSLPGRMLNFNFPPLSEGYVSAEDGFGAAISDPLFQSYESGYVRIIPLGQGSSPLPYLTTTILTFASEDGPLGIISGGVKFQRPYEQIERVDLAPIEGADAAGGFHFISPVGEGDEIDSFRILSVVGNYLVAITVQAAESEDVAKRLALGFTEAQLACIEQGDCELIEEVNTRP